ncbi:MAG TPA: cobalamin-binding protein [Solirubrobacteraceae bacterium]|nr:cobalamin-binding protein [Solirubrobacteraceae bacterium]
MRIVSLVPHATELLFALGLGDQVIAVTHECDYPPQAIGLPRATRDMLEPGLTSLEIDAAVRDRTEQGLSIYELDGDLVRRLAPDLIVTQALCPVCAVSYEDVAALAATMPARPRVIALDPHTLGETLGDVRTLAEATGRRDAGIALIARVAGRIDRVRLAVRGADRPRVAAIEWFDPIYVAGHWTPQLIELAGGEDVLGGPGEPSEQSSWDLLARAKPQVVVAMPCGYGAARARIEATGHVDRLRATGADRVVAVDAASYFSRPGPRLVDGLELLAHILHPELAPQPPDQILEVAL